MQFIKTLVFIVFVSSYYAAKSDHHDDWEESNRLPTSSKYSLLKDWYRRQLSGWRRRKTITPSPPVVAEDNNTRKANVSSATVDLATSGIINRITNGISAFIESSMVDLHEEWVMKNQFNHENSIGHGFWRQDACPCPSSSFDCPTQTLVNTTTDENYFTYSYFTCSTSSECANFCSASLTCAPPGCTMYTALTVTYFTSYSYITIVNQTSLTTSQGSSSTTAITSAGVGCDTTTDCPTSTGGGGGGGYTTIYATTNIYNSGGDPGSGSGGGGELKLVKIPVAAAAGVLVGLGAAQAAPVLLKKASDIGHSMKEKPSPAHQMQQQLNYLFRGYHHQELRGVPTEELFILPAPQVPINDMPIPVRTDPRHNGLFIDDECGDASVRFVDGQCYPLLSQGPCYDDRHWLIIDPITFEPRCSLRLCGPGRVFVGYDGLCHEIEYEPDECQGGRRLYYTAFGDPICDCPIGQVPFPGPRDNCIPLFIQGPCLPGLILTFSRPDGVLGCFPSECNLATSLDDDRDLQRLLPSADGFCYEFGTRGPCNQGFIFTYDLFKLKTLCVSVQNGWLLLSDQESNYILYLEDQDDENKLKNEAAAAEPEVEDEGVYHVTMVLKNKKQLASLMNSGDVTQLPPSPKILFPRSLDMMEQKPEVLLYSDDEAKPSYQQRRQIPPDPLLNPCRTGARIGYNWKCSNPILSTEWGNRRSSNQINEPVKPDYTCPGIGEVLLASGRCGHKIHGPSCGPSYDYANKDNNNRCRSIFHHFYYQNRQTTKSNQRGAGRVREVKHRKAIRL